MRIVSLAPSNTEILFAIGSGRDIVARTAYCDYPREALAIPKVGSWTTPDVDEIRRLEPDAILTSTVVQEKLAASLMAEGLPVTHFDPRSLNAVFESILQIGELAGKRAGAEALVQQMEDSFHSLLNSMPVAKPRLYIEEWHEPPFASGNWVPKVAEVAGADCGLAREGELSREVSLEEVEAFDPDMIILSICGVKSSPSLLEKRKGWAGLRAVKSGNAFSMDDSLLNRPGPRLVKGAEELRKIISSWLRTSG